MPPVELFKKFACYATVASRGLIKNVPVSRYICHIMSHLFSGIPFAGTERGKFVGGE